VTFEGPRTDAGDRGEHLQVDRLGKMAAQPVERADKVGRQGYRSDVSGQAIGVGSLPVKFLHRRSSSPPTHKLTLFLRFLHSGGGICIVGGPHRRKSQAARIARRVRVYDARNRNRLRPCVVSSCDRTGGWSFNRGGARQIRRRTRRRNEAQAIAGRPLYWRIENFETLAAAKAAAGPTSLAAEVAGKVWLFTLGLKGGSSAGGSKVIDIGPIPPLAAPEYLLRINRAGGPPGTKTATHSHPGSEAFCVLAGRMSQRTSHGTVHLDAGQSAPGHGADMPMEVGSSGATDLDQLVMFVVDATRPFSSPAKFD
jgi:hypothetical protein